MIKLQHFTGVFLAALLAAGASSCNSNSDPLPVTAYAIELSVDITGSTALVTEIQWANSAGQITTVPMPALPWTQTFSYFTGQTAQLIVTGTTGAGSTITGRIQDDPALIVSPVTYVDSTCPENTDPCSIDISHTF